MKKIIILLTLFFTVTAFAQQERDKWGVNREITKISKSVYRWGSDGQSGAYIVTSEGIVVLDGHYCKSGTMDWLKKELKKRHDVPVKFVLLSHDHPDHICNTQIFDDTALSIGHRNIRPHIIREKRVSSLPTLTFETEMDIELGELTITLLYFGPSHSDNLIQVHIPEEKVLLAMDMAKGKSLFPDYRDMDVHGMLKALKILSRLDDVDIVVPGHGPVVKQDNFMHQHRYIKTLHDRVMQHMIDGKSLTDIRRLVTMDEFKDYRLIDLWLDSNIVTMYDFLYRYREPNKRIEDYEAVECQLDYTKCRTSN